MDAWNAAKLILDVSFGVIVTLALVAFIYFRERRIRKLIANYVAGKAAQESPQFDSETSEADAPFGPEPAGTSPAGVSSPPLLARYQSASEDGRQRDAQASSTPSRSPGLSRTEKYLEAVRMYRDGRRREDIERNLGISFMELEMLGQLK